MTYTTPGTRKCLTAAIFAAAIAMPSTSQAALDDIVIIKGTSTDSSMPWAHGPGVESFADVCNATNALIIAAAGAVASSGMSSYVFDLLPAGPGVLLDCSEAQETEGRYAIQFTSCSMLMTDGVHSLRWIVPPGASEAQMIIADAQTGETLTGGEVMLETQLSEVPDFAKGRETSQSVKRASGSKSYDVQLEIGPTGNYRYSTETYSGQAYAFDYSGRVSLPGMDAVPGMGDLSVGNMVSEGTAWISPDVPGADVVAKFYENFKTYVVPATGQGTLFTAMIEQMADVVAYGMPLETTQTVTMGSAVGLAGMGMESTSTSKVKSITVWQGAASEHQECGPFETPEGFEEVSMQEMMSGSNVSPADAQQMNEAMQQASEAMEQMTPEQRQMMEQLGLGGMMPGAPAASSAGAAPGGGSSGGAMPSRAELHSDDMAQMVQKHLQALGYDPGNADGDVTTDTIIAISEFQADQGLKVTGEVSPQLAGVLSAEVDKRR